MMLEPLGGSNTAHSFAYWGERQEWLVALSHHRDSDALERSNWTVITDDLLIRFGDGGDGGPGLEGEDIAIESMSNWAVGWTEHLLVRPGTPAAAAAEEWAKRLANYPVANEEHYGLLEWDEEWCVRCDRGIRTDHPLMDRHGHQCKFRSEDDASEIDYAWRHRRDSFGPVRPRGPLRPDDGWVE